MPCVPGVIGSCRFLRLSIQFSREFIWKIYCEFNTPRVLGASMQRKHNEFARVTTHSVCGEVVPVRSALLVLFWQQVLIGEACRFSPQLHGVCPRLGDVKAPQGYLSL